MSTFDEDLFLKGLEQRKATLGAEYVEKNLAAADDFTRPFQEAMTAWCWGFGWGDDVIYSLISSNFRKFGSRINSSIMKNAKLA